jgi:hypothetical protein
VCNVTVALKHLGYYAPTGVTVTMILGLAGAPDVAFAGIVGKLT